MKRRRSAKDTPPLAGTFARQPVHTVYGGAHLFRAGTARKLGDLALRALEEHAPDAGALARALEQPDGALRDVYSRAIEKLRHEPVEDFRIDFEDGYGHRPRDEEDGHARSAAAEVAAGMREGSLPPFIGIRIKALTPELFARSARTLELFLGALMKSAGRVPEPFVVTLPKVENAGQVRALAGLLGAIERRHRLRRGALGMELMVEAPRAVIGVDGRLALPALVRAAQGRCVAAHFGAYDYTSALDVSAPNQTLLHPACELARQLMLVSLHGSGVAVSDGATNVLPVGTQDAVHRAWRLSWRHIRHALAQGIYQGWDLHPAQLPIRYAATYAFFREARPAMSERLKAFVERAAQATLVGSVFDDAASGQGLLNFFLRGMACGAISEAEARETGLSVGELRGRSFPQVVEARRAGAAAKR